MFLSLLDLLRQRAGPDLPLDPSFTPQMEWRDEGGFLVLLVDLKGIDPRSVQVQLSETSLGLVGQRTQEERQEGPGYVWRSSSYALFSRVLPLPVRVMPHQSRAEWLTGERLRVQLKKA